MERCKYRNPPIEEALCEFRFVPSQDWDPTVPGRFHKKIPPVQVVCTFLNALV